MTNQSFVKQSHIPVLRAKVVEIFRAVNGVFIDATVGAGGHALAVAKANLKLVGIDQDHDALTVASSNLKAQISKLDLNYDHTITLVHGNFRNIKQILCDLKIAKVNGILADLGVSSMQLEDPQRGFSFKRVAPLDMRMNQINSKVKTKISKSQLKIQKSPIISHDTDFMLHDTGLSAWQIIHTWDERKIADILWQYGEKRFARKIAHAIREYRREINTTKDLAALVEKCVPPRFRKHGLHPATKTFQALRIAVNDEIGALKEFLQDAPELLAKGGRLAIISFHSLEDRLVKQRFHELAADGNYRLLTKHPIVAIDDEVAVNSRSRSAKLRAIEKI